MYNELVGTMFYRVYPQVPAEYMYMDDKETIKNARAQEKELQAQRLGNEADEQLAKNEESSIEEYFKPYYFLREAGYLPKQWAHKAVYKLVEEWRKWNYSFTTISRESSRHHSGMKQFINDLETSDYKESLKWCLESIFNKNEAVLQDYWNKFRQLMKKELQSAVEPFELNLWKSSGV